jgi:16S rRNA (adenine(1408)-N(1))-methyltransferase
VVVDIGTGDGRYVYRSARSDPDRFYIGIDAERGALQKVSEKIHRKPAKGGLSNVLFVLAPVEDLPSELVQVADEIHIHFPWGSLLRSVVVGDEEVLAGLHRIAAPDAWLEILIGIDEVRDQVEIRRLQLPSLTGDYIRSTLAPRYARAGFNLGDCGVLPRSQWPYVETTWAKRPQGSDHRRLVYLLARA